MTDFDFTAGATEIAKAAAANFTTGDETKGAHVGAEAYPLIVAVLARAYEAGRNNPREQTLTAGAKAVADGLWKQASAIASKALHPSVRK